MPDDIVALTLNEAATHLLEECRMVLPGIQALLGFQFVAVFSNGFPTALTQSEHVLHLVAIVCVVMAVALVMAPAALHRRCEPHSVSERFLDLSSAMLMWSLAPLAVGTTLDVYLVARVIAHSRTVAGLVAAFALVAFAGFWVILPVRARLPRLPRLQRAKRKES